MTSAGRPPLITQHDKQARTYEREVYPLIGQRLADLLMLDLSLPARAHALQIGCGLGTTTADLLRRLDADGRLVAIESSQALIDRARAAVAPEHLGRRVFFRAHALDGKLPFADGAFDCTLANAELADLESPAAFLSEATRITKPGGKLRLATLVRGSWREFIDVFGDVLVRLGKDTAADALRAYVAAFPEPEALARQLEESGLEQVGVETTHWELVFRTAREFFYAPVIERGPLARWKALAGKGAEVQDIFLAVKQAIDTYFGSNAFAVTLVGGVFSGTRSAVIGTTTPGQV